MPPATGDDRSVEPVAQRLSQAFRQWACLFNYANIQEYPMPHTGKGRPMRYAMPSLVCAALAISVEAGSPPMASAYTPDNHERYMVKGGKSVQACSRCQNRQENAQRDD